MAHFNEIVVKTAKNRKNTQKVVKASLAEHYPDYSLQDLYAEDGEWKATLLKELTASEVAKLAGLPFEEESVEEEVAETPEEDKSESEGEAPKKDKKSDGEKSDEKSKGDGEGLEEAGDELARIEDILQELNDRVRQLQDKANVVDEIHESTKPHVEKLEEELGEEVPMAPPAPPTPGGAPGGPGGPVGPSAPPKPPFAASTKIAYASIKQDGIEFSMPEVVEAMHQHFAHYEVVDIKKDVANNKYVAKLERKK